METIETTEATGAKKEWRLVHEALSALAKRRAGLDAEEARWLRRADVARVWRPLGMVSILDYVEKTLGYQLSTAKERVRVAKALGDLTLLERALESGELSWSAV